MNRSAVLSVKTQDMELNVNTMCHSKETKLTSRASSCAENNICNFCIKLIKDGFFLFLRSDDLGVTHGKCVVEFDLGTTREPKICASCHDYLQCHFTFLKNCLYVEGKISDYRKVEGLNSKGQVKLSNVSCCTSKFELQSKNENGSLNVLKVEEISCNQLAFGSPGCEIKTEKLIKVDKGELGFKEDIKLETDETNCNRSQDNVLFSRRSKGAREYECNICGYKHMYKKKIKRHMLVHKSAPEVPMYKCEVCSHQTKYKYNMRLHMILHKSTSEVPMYTCELCGHQTKRKRSLEEHMLLHKSTSEVPMYKCKMCIYQTKYKNSIQRHMLVHKSTEEVRMYKCDICDHQTKHKSNLQLHMRVHKSPSEAPVPDREMRDKMYLCEVCTHQTKYKANLRRHMLIHESTAEVLIYKCDVCEYQAKYKHSLQLHMLIHKSSSEVTMHKCRLCTFETKYKKNLKSHMSLHKNSSEAL